MRIKDLDIKGRLILAPMSGITSLPFRLQCKKNKAALAYSEMINADAFIYENPKTRKRAYFIEEERPIGIQLMGSSIEKLKKAAKKIEKELAPDLIDINIGCPAYNVMKTGSGASLLNNPGKLKKIIEEISNAINIPLTCKIRITNDEKKTLEIAKLIEKSGAKAIAVHGRTAKQGYSGKANWKIIKKIKHNLSIPVILNGDVVDEYSAGAAFKETGCDAVMIGRAAIGNPYIFKRISHYLDTGELLNELSFEEKAGQFIEFIGLCKEYGYNNLLFIKRYAQSFIKGFKGSKALRHKITEAKSIKEIVLALKTFKNNP